jgi:hypothetical protein
MRSFTIYWYEVGRAYSMHGDEKCVPVHNCGRNSMEKETAWETWTQMRYIKKDHNETGFEVKY